MIKGLETKSRILESSYELFRSRGFHNTSMNDVVESTGVKKGNLYFHYPSKESLVIEILRDASAEYTDYINKRIKSTTCAGRLNDILDAVFDYNTQEDTIRGCIFGNLALELGGSGTNLEEYLRKWFNRRERDLENEINNGIRTGEMVLKEEPAVFAKMILAAVEGGILLGKISGSTEPLVQCMNYIKSAIKERSVRG